MYAARCQVGCFAFRRTNIVIIMAGFGLPVEIAVTVTVDMTTWRGACCVCFIL